MLGYSGQVVLDIFLIFQDFRNFQGGVDFGDIKLLLRLFNNFRLRLNCVKDWFLLLWLCQLVSDFEVPVMWTLRNYVIYVLGLALNFGKLDFGVRNYNIFITLEVMNSGIHNLVATATLGGLLPDFLKELV